MPATHRRAVHTTTKVPPKGKSSRRASLQRGTEDDEGGGHAAEHRGGHEQGQGQQPLLQELALLGDVVGHVEAGLHGDHARGGTPQGHGDADDSCKSALMTGEVSPRLGFGVHAVLSLAFGMLFALVVPALRSNGTVALAGGVYGALLYLVNFQLLGRIFFDQFLQGPNQPFELVVHVVFGHLLALAFYSSGIRSGERVVTLGGQPATAGVGRI
jgi:hypothetical protein